MTLCFLKCVQVIVAIREPSDKRAKLHTVAANNNKRLIYYYLFAPGLRSRRFLGGVGFVRTLEVGVGFFYPKWIIFYIAHLFWNSYWNTESCCVPRFSLIVSCYKIVDSQTSFILCYGVGNFVRVGHFTSDSVPLVRTTYTVYMCCFSRTSRSWCIAHSTPRLPSGCNAGNAGETQCLTSSSAFQKLLFLISKVLRQFSDRFYCVIS